MDDTRVMRARQEAAMDAIDSAQGGAEPRGSGAMLAQTTTDETYPTTPAAFFAVVSCDIDGSESEGAISTYVPRAGAKSYALNLGTTVPPVGSTVVCHAVGGRWCFRWDS